VWLAARGVLAVTGLILVALGIIASIVAAFEMARRGGRGLAQLPILATEGIAWSAGVTLAYGAALRALHGDREDGILSLFRARGATVAEYVGARVGGLVILLVLAVGCAALVATIAATSAAGETNREALLPGAVSGAAAVTYAVAFAVTIGPVAMASLGARSRVGGYFALLAILVVPELLAPWTSALLPRDWHELTSIPAALEAVRDGFAWPFEAWRRGARAVAGLSAVVAVALVVVGARIAHADAGPAS
ncbi:MAG: hypothetical protein M3O46_11405, partial [Myxococcota bacterium]|nr:hypothetical protein [Myxococcota bacterium]